MTGHEPPSSPILKTSATPEELAQRVAATLIGLLRRVQDEGRIPDVVLTGGTIAATVHATIASSPDRHLVDWSRVNFWWGDERYVPADDHDRNALQADEAMLRHLDVTPERVHTMPASDDAYASLGDATEAYGEELREHGPAAFDLVMLGVGPDGHVASLFPGSRQLDVKGADTVAVADSPKPPPQRISLTFAALNRAGEVWFLASGEGKAEAVARALGGADVRDIPATGVHGRERTVWFLDADAAGQLD